MSALEKRIERLKLENEQLKLDVKVLEGARHNNQDAYIAVLEAEIVYLNEELSISAKNDAVISAKLIG